MKLRVNKDKCEIIENEVWNVGDYNVQTVQVELSDDFNDLVNKVRYFVEDKCYDMLIENNIAQIPYEATKEEGTIKIGVYGFEASTDILVQSTTPITKYITSGTYTGDPDNTEPLTPTDKQQMQTAIQKNTNDITNLKANKQDKLISGVNIKTINNESILSSGNLTLVAEETDPIFTNSPAYSITDNDITYWNNKANMSDIPDVSNFITKDVDNLTYYTKSTDMQTTINNVVGNERIARENADTGLQNQINVKQDTLISGTNIKTINNESLLGSGNIDIQGGGTSDYSNLTNKPSINNVTLSGNKSLSDLGIQPAGSYATTIDLEDKQNIEDNNLETTRKTIVGAINEVNDVVKGSNQALSFANYSTMVTTFNSLDDDEYHVGQNLYIVTVNVPDLWISSVESTSSTYTYTTDSAFISALETNGYVQVGYYKLSMLETQKVDLTNYVTNTDYASQGTAGVIKTNANYAIETNSSNGNIQSQIKDYSSYTSGSSSMFISKGTLENVITGKGLITSSSDITGNASTSTTLKSFIYSRNGTNYTWAKVATAKLIGTWEERHAYLFIKGTHSTNFKQNGIISIDAVGGRTKAKVISYSAQFISASTDLNLENFYIEYQDGNDNTPAIINFWIRNTTSAYATWQVKILQNTGWTIENSNTSVTTLPTQDFTGKISELNNKTLNDKDGNDISTTYVKNTDYASNNTGGVIKVDGAFSTFITDGKLKGSLKTYEDYQNLSSYAFISKGTLENVITGKELDLKQLSTFDSTKTQVLKNINGTLTWVNE